MSGQIPASAWAAMSGSMGGSPGLSGDENWQPVMNMPRRQKPYSVDMPYENPDYIKLAMLAGAAPPEPQSGPIALPPKDLPGGGAHPPALDDGDPDYLALLRGIKDKGFSNAREQRGAAQDLQPFLDNMAQPNLQHDLSPLMALVDQRTGSNLAQSYKAPESGKERIGDMMKLKQGLANMGIQASETELNSLREFAQGTFGLEKFKSDQQYKSDSLAAQREQNAIGRAKLASERPSEAVKVVDRKFGAMYAEDIIGGNFAGAQNEIANLKDLQNQIASGAIGKISGPEIKYSPNFMNPEATAARQRVERAVQSSMRATLGAQFTEKEGQQILARTFDPELPQAENARRLKILVNSLERAAQAKRSAYQYYETNKTMAGFRGTANIEGDFLNSTFFDASNSGKTAAKGLETMSEEELDALLEAERAKLKGG